MKPQKSKKLSHILTSVLLTLAVYSGALFIYLYASGWRLDIFNQEVKQTGVLTIESRPTLANIYVNGESKGRTDKSMALDVGTYAVEVSKDGYYDWNKDIRILEEKSTPVFPWLIKTEFEEKIAFNSDKVLEKYWVDETDNHLLLLLKEDTGYELVHYDINTEFWELSNNPMVILSLESTEDLIFEDIDLQLSHTGEFAILEITDNTASSRYVIQTNRLTLYKDLSANKLNLKAFTDYKLSWSYDDNYLILESDEDVISYNISKETKHLLLKKSNTFDKWSTDDHGFFYIFKHIDTSVEEILTYSLQQYRLDGSSQRELIPTIYLHNNTEYIKSFRSTGFDFSFFTNSPECTQTIGEITEFIVNQKAKGIYIETTQSTYWYDMTTGKYITISPYPVELIAFSPDNDKLLFKNSTYEIFTFDKENGDHTVKIGSKDIDNLIFDQIKDINWVSNSSYVSIDEDNFIYIADKDGENKTPLLSNEGILYWSITSSREKLTTLTYDTETGVNIVEYTIH